MIAELLSSLANNVVARQYDLPEWSTFLKTAFKSFGTKAFGTELGDARANLENELERPLKLATATSGI
jgi:hypothetical protein